MKNEKQQQAHNLYFQTNLSQAQIARVLEVTPKTIYNWMSEGRWRQQKKLVAHMPSKIVEQQYYMLANLGHEILSRGHQPYPLTHEGEQMRKIATTIRHLKNRQTVNEAMESFTHLAEVISHKDPELAQRLMPHIQDYVQSRVDIKFADLTGEDFQVNPAMDEMYDYEIRPADDDDTGGITDPADPATDPDSSGGASVPADDYESLTNPYAASPAPVTTAIPETLIPAAAQLASACELSPDSVAASYLKRGRGDNLPPRPVRWIDPDDLTAPLAEPLPTNPKKPMLVAA